MLLDRESENQTQDLLLATVASVTNNGLTMILDGESEATQKKYKYMTSAYPDPSVGDRVVVMRLSGTYVVLGKIGSSTPATEKYVRRSGDTMTGALNMNGADINLRSTTNTIGTVPETSVSDKRVYFRDKLNVIFGKLQSIFMSDGRIGMQLGTQRAVNGSTVENNVNLYIDASGNRTVTFTSPAVWRSALNAVNKAGDTMTGNLTLMDAHIHMDDPNFTVGTRPSTNQWSKPLRIRDSAEKTLGRIQGFYGTDGTCGLQLYADQLVNGEGKYNFLSLNIGETGVASINMNHPEAWRQALGLGTNGSLPLTIAQGGSGNTGVVSESTIANIATAGTNITLTSASFSQWGKLAMIQVNGNCSEAVASGSTLFTLVSGKRPVTYSSAQVWQSTSNTAVIYADGKAVLGGGGFSANTGFTILAAYLLP